VTSGVPTNSASNPQASGPLRACPLHGITAWDPQLPSSTSYLWERLGQNSSGTYIWTHSFSNPISSVQVAPPIDSSTPYQKDIDYSGLYSTSLDLCPNEVDLGFPSPGVYAVPVNFASGAPYLEFLWAGAEEANDDQVENGRALKMAVPSLRGCSKSYIGYFGAL
jgi:hypothetical protein